MKGRKINVILERGSFRRGRGGGRESCVAMDRERDPPTSVSQRQEETGRSGPCLFRWTLGRACLEVSTSSERESCCEAYFLQVVTCNLASRQSYLGCCFACFLFSEN